MRVPSIHPSRALLSWHTFVLNKRHVAAFDGTDPSDPRLVLPFCINMHESQISPSIESFECFARLLVYTL